MSYTTIMALWPGEKVEHHLELNNSHGSAPVIWSRMCRKYLGADEHRYMFDSTLDKLWPLWKESTISKHQRAVLMMTYSRAYILKKDYSRAAQDIRKFLSDFLVPANNVNHWPRIAEFYESNPDIPAIGLWVTSLSENPFQGEWNEEKGDYDQIDWTQAYDLYEQIDALEMPEVSIGKAS